MSMWNVNEMTKVASKPRHGTNGDAETDEAPRADGQSDSATRPLHVNALGSGGPQVAEESVCV